MSRLTVPGRVGSVPGRLVGMALALLIALGVLGAVGIDAARSDVAPDGEITATGERASVMTEAARLTTLAMSWRAASSAEDIAAAKAVMTKRMQAEYDKTLPAESERAGQAKQKVAVSAVVTPLTATTRQPEACTPELCSVGLLSATRERVEALLFVNQTASAQGNDNSVVSPTWEVVTLVRQDGAWLIDQMVAP